MADVLGTGATAALVRRALRNAAKRRPELRELSMSRNSLTYAFNLPDSWNQPDPGDLQSLRDLIGELSTLLEQLTGQVVLRRLERNPLVRPHLPKRD